MEFRWVALIALWTLLSGPIFHTAAPRMASRAPAGMAANTAPVRP